MKTILLIFIFISVSTLTIFSQDRVPAWAKKVIWYQIFPERFSNGDSTNDPKPIDMKGGWPYKIPQGWHISPWTSQWYKLQPWEKADGHGFNWNAGVRRYGGDLQGVLNKLDYPQKLGITAIYFNPLFESPSLHKYDASMYRHIDNNFGPNPNKDRQIWATENPNDQTTWKWTTADSLFLELIKECHKRGIKVILDGVFNHVGTTFWAFKDVIKNQQKSKYKDWFYITSFDNPKTPQNEFDYKGWYGVKDLPEFREDKNGLVKGPRNLIHEIVKRWMDPNNDGNPSDGIDGWRLDVAEMVKHNFWKTFRKWVKRINPNAYIVGEVWWEDWPHNKMFNAAPWLKGDEFDAVMNYRFARAVKRFVADKKIGVGPKGFIDSLKNQYRNYNKANVYVMLDLLDSHDTERLASMLVNPDHYFDHNANPEQNKNWSVREPNKIERMKEKLMVGIQMTLPGAPCIYYGDEAGMWGGDDPDDRKPMVWKEFKYEAETLHPFGRPRPTDSVKFDESLFNWYRKLISIRKNNEQLTLGDIKFRVINENEKILAYKRSFDNSTIYVIINNDVNENKIILKKDSFFDINKPVVDLVSNVTHKLFKNNLVLFLKPFQILIIKDKTN